MGFSARSRAILNFKVKKLWHMTTNQQLGVQLVIQL
jgi:hypothetical protein